MNNRAVTLSLLMAVVAVYMVNSHVESIEEKARKTYGAEVTVLKAKRDIKESETLDESAFEFDRMPKKFLEPSAVAFEKKTDDPETLKSLKSLTGTVALVPIRKGEQITINKIIEPGIRTGLSPQIAPGKRAIAVPVNEVTGVAKLVKPGDRVDVIAVVDIGQGRMNRTVRTVLQDVVVLAVGRNVTNNIARILERDWNGKERARSLTDDSSFASVTLEVDPTQVQAISLIVSNPDNSILLSLRNNDDQERTTVAPTQLSEVLNTMRAPAATPPPAGGTR